MRLKRWVSSVSMTCIDSHPDVNSGKQLTMHKEYVLVLKRFLR
jgi:hypothetical protein